MPRREEPMDDPELPELTARPSERASYDPDDEKLVPMANMGGAAPTERGLDSGGNLPGSEDDLPNLVEPEPPEAPELSAVHVHDDEDERHPEEERDVE